MVGDPSGRNREREKMASEVLQDNIAGITENLDRIDRNESELSDHNTPMKLKLVDKINDVVSFIIYTCTRFICS